MKGLSTFVEMFTITINLCADVNNVYSKGIIQYCDWTSLIDD